MRERLYQLSFITHDFMKVGYFRQLFFCSTLAAFLILTVAFRQNDALELAVVATTVWKKTAFIGFWSTCTAAAGILGMARFQGVLSPILAAPRGGITGVFLLIAPPSLLGIGAFPLAYTLTSLWYRTLLPLGINDLLNGGLIILTGYLMTLSIASLFLISRHASTYEILILIPLFAICGILFPHPQIPTMWQTLIAPFSLPLYLFLTGHSLINLPVFSILTFLFSTLVWLGTGLYLVHKLLRRAFKTGSLEKR